jgi:glyoxylase-like metal-dependent hydrolase (beta-lactamase superfamily II)
VESAGWHATVLDVGMVPIDSEHLGPDGAFSGRLETPVNVLLLRGHRRTILVDAGSGALTPIWPGSTDVLAEALDVEPDLLVATHLDFDHAGGYVAGTWPDRLVPAFPGVRVLAPTEALAAARASTDEMDPSARVVAVLDEHGLLDGYGDGDEPGPGLLLRSAPGHRAGHSILEVGQALVHAADTFHHSLHVEHPEWDTAFDSDPEVGLETRRALLAELVDRDVTVVVSHIAGAGLVERAGDGFRWNPVEI